MPEELDQEQRLRDESSMWCDLLMGHLHAESAHFGVTRRAELYVRVAGLPLDRVLDALQTDEPGWQARLAALRIQEQRNQDAAERHDLAPSRDSGAEDVS